MRGNQDWNIGQVNNGFFTGNTMLDSSLIPQSLLANDSGDGIGISGNTALGSGAITVLPNRHFRYQPGLGFVGGLSGLDDDAVATWNARGNTPTATTANVNVSLTGTATAPRAGTPLVPTNPLP